MQLHDPRDFRIFIADDDEAILDLVRTRLMVVGYQVSFAQDGVEALRVIAAERPHGVLLDVNMPLMDGFTVLKKMRAAPLTAVTPVMMLTARNAPKDVESAIAFGATDFLMKPFATEALLMRTARLVRSKVKERT